MASVTAHSEAGTRAPAASSALTVCARDAHRALPERRHTVQYASLKAELNTIATALASSIDTRRI
jgi:hypothetical protein